MTSPHETLQNSFPGPRVSAVAFILAPLLLTVGAAFLMEFEGGEFEDIQQRIADSPMRAAIGLNVFIAGWLFAMICVFALARLIAQRRPLLAAFGGMFAVLGIVVSLNFSGVATIEHALALYPDRAVANEVGVLVAPPPIIFALLPGRAASCSIPLDHDPWISSEHATLVREGARFTLTDEHSRNGTWVDWERVLPGRSVSLHPGSLLTIGRTILVLQLRERSEPTGSGR